MVVVSLVFFSGVFPFIPSVLPFVAVFRLVLGVLLCFGRRFGRRIGRSLRNLELHHFSRNDVCSRLPGTLPDIMRFLELKAH